jgi:multidrug resistance protein, MATE family
MANAGIIARMISRDSIVAAESIRYMYIAFIFEPVMAWGVILAGGLSGAGDTKAVMLIIALSVWLVRIPLSYILGIVLGFGPVAVWWSMNLSILAQSVFLSKRYFSKRWMYLYREVEGGKCVSAV